MSIFEPNEYYKPTTVAEAIKILTKYGKKSKAIAGGTDLLVEKPANLQCLVDIKGLNLDYIKKENNGIKIGAATLLNTIESSEVFSQNPHSVLSLAVSMMATPTIKNMGTIGGNICNASPAADLALPLMVLDANLKITGPDGNRVIPVGEFFRGVKQTALKSGELLTEIQIPHNKSSKSTFLKLKRHQTAIDLAIVNVAIRLKFSGGICEEARLAVGSVAKTPVYARQAETKLIGQKITAELIRDVAKTVSLEVKPIDDIRASAWYRKKMVTVLVIRAIETCTGDAKYGQN